MTISLSAAIRFPFRGPHRWANLGLALVCFLIPIVGPIVLLGYAALVEKTLIDNPDADAPAFDFSFFVDHLKRGVPPFVVALILIPVVWLFMIPVVPVVILAVFVGPDRPVAFTLIIIAASLLYLALLCVASLLFAPVTLKAMLEQTIGGAFNWSFISGYFRRVGWIALGYQLLLMACSFLVLPFTLCCPFILPYVSAVVFSFASWHLQVQLYLLYLERGGEPLQIKTLQPPGAFPVSMLEIPPPSPP